MGTKTIFCQKNKDSSLGGPYFSIKLVPGVPYYSRGVRGLSGILKTSVDSQLLSVIQVFKQQEKGPSINAKLDTQQAADQHRSLDLEFLGKRVPLRRGCLDSPEILRYLPTNE